MAGKDNTVLENNPSKFFAHHVGGREGSVSFPTLPQFTEDIINIIYDADESCLAQVEQKWKGHNVKVYPYCLSDKNGTAKFHINFDPYTSSLYPLNEEYGHFYERHGNLDYLFQYSLETQRTIDVETFSLDYLIENKKVPSPDFLSIDTQGAESSILHGAVKALNSSTIAVMCEVNFVELYKGIPLFGELDSFMRSQNFILATLTPLDKGYRRIPRAYRGKGMPIQGEALYFRNPKFITGSDEEVKIRLEKLAFASIVFGFTELSSEALEKSSNIPLLDEKKIGYRRILSDFTNGLSKQAFLPKLWNDSVTFEESVKRFDVNSATKTTHPMVFKMKSFVKSILTTLQKPTELELLFRKNGLFKAADEVKKRKSQNI